VPPETREAPWWLRPPLGPRHAQIIQAIGRSPALKRRLVERSREASVGTRVQVADRHLELGAVLGHGMLAITYEAHCEASGERLALKWARADVPLLHRLFRAEAEASRELPRLAGLRTAVVVAESDACLLKTLYTGPTLQELMADGRVEPVHIQALEEVLGRVRALWQRHAFYAEASPKNLCWEGDGFRLLDTGQPFLINRFVEQVLPVGTWEAYRAYYGPRVRTRHSEPSVLSAPVEAAPPPREVPCHAFLREWWTWLPLEAPPPPGMLLATVDPGIVEDELVFLMELQPEGWRMSPAPHARAHLASDPALIARAVEEWRLLHPSEPYLPPPP
jgi:hypothetical protein